MSSQLHYLKPAVQQNLLGMQPDRRPSVIYWPVQQYGSKGNQQILIVPALGLTSSSEYNDAISDFDFDRAPESWMLGWVEMGSLEGCESSSFEMGGRSCGPGALWSTVGWNRASEVEVSSNPSALVSMGPLGRPRTLVIIEIARKRSTNECILEREDHTAADQFEEISSPK